VGGIKGMRELGRAMETGNGSRGKKKMEKGTQNEEERAEGGRAVFMDVEKAARRLARRLTESSGR
jgi:hypothetical protein